MRSLHVFCALVLGLILVACSVNRRELLQTTVDNYVKAIRRGDEEAVISFVKPDHMTEFYKEVQKLNEIHISHFEAKTIFPDEEFKTALVTIMIEYFSATGDAVVQSRKYLTWMFDEKMKAWLLDETTPFGKSENPKAIKPTK